MIEAIDNAADNNVTVSPDDYLGTDGLLRCGKCGGKKETVINLLGEQKTVKCVCECAEKELEQQQMQQRTEQLRRACFSSPRFLKFTFEADNEPNSEASIIARNYADSFDVSESDWLVLSGDTGTGKTFRAACICNGAVEKGFSARLTTLSEIERELWNTHDKQSVYDRLTRTQLLVLDDFGCERRSDYMNEIKYNVICERYDKGLPMVITTNLAPAQFKSDDIGDRRIFSRIFERAVFVSVGGEDKRKERLLETMKEKKEKLMGSAV